MKHSVQDKGTLLLALIAGLSINGAFAALFSSIVPFSVFPILSLLVGLRPYRLLLATLPLRVLRQDVVANVWPLKIWIPAVSVVVVGLLAWLLGGSPLLWSVLAGAVVLALLCGLVGWGLLWLLKRLTLKALPLRLAECE